MPQSFYVSGYSEWIVFLHKGSFLELDVQVYFAGFAAFIISKIKQLLSQFSKIFISCESRFENSFKNHVHIVYGKSLSVRYLIYLLKLAP